MDLLEKRHNNLARHPWEIARFKIIAHLFNKLAKNKNENFTVLDIGCGDTYIAEQFLKIYRKANYLAVDNAFSTQMIENYNAFFKDKIIKLNLFQNLNDIEIEVFQKADFVFLFDVIEHIENEVNFLADLNKRNLLADSVKIFISVPAFQSLFTSHDIFLKHYRRYNRTQLVTVISQAGLTTIDQGFFFFTLLFPRMLQVFLKRKIKKQHEVGIGQWEGKGWLDKAIVAALMVDYYFTTCCRVVGIKLPGLSNYIVCKKS